MSALNVDKGIVSRETCRCFLSLILRMGEGGCLLLMG